MQEAQVKCLRVGVCVQEAQSVFGYKRTCLRARRASVFGFKPKCKRKSVCVQEVCLRIRAKTKTVCLCARSVFA